MFEKKLKRSDWASLNVMIYAIDFDMLANLISLDAHTDPEILIRRCLIHM